MSEPMRAHHCCWVRKASTSSLSTPCVARNNYLAAGVSRGTSRSAVLFCTLLTSVDTA